MEGKDISAVVDDSCEKLQLFMSHQLRCVVQPRRLLEVYQVVRAGYSMDYTILTIYNKMKLDPTRFREKTTEFCKRKDMS